LEDETTAGKHRGGACRVRCLENGALLDKVENDFPPVPLVMGPTHIERARLDTVPIATPKRSVSNCSMLETVH
jgi:hypothetical protein